MTGQHGRSSGPLPRLPTRSTATARGTAIQNVSFFLLVALTTVAFLALIVSFLMPVFWAAVLATVFFPLQQRYVARLGGRRSLAALLTMLTIIGLVVVPLLLVGAAVTREAAQLHDEITLCVWDERFAGRLRDAFARDLERSDEIEPGRWRSRPLRQRAAEAATTVLRREL